MVVLSRKQRKSINVEGKRIINLQNKIVSTDLQIKGLEERIKEKENKIKKYKESMIDVKKRQSNKIKTAKKK